MSLLLRQIRILIWKDLLLIFNRKSRQSTLWRAFFAPIIVAAYICFIFRVYFPKAFYGFGEVRDVRNLTDAMLSTADKRPHLVLVNQGPKGGDIDLVIETIAAPLKAAGRNVTISDDDNTLREICRSGLTATTPCFGGVVFHSSPNEGGIWNYTLRADAALGLTTVDIRKSTNDAQQYVLPFQHAIDSAIAAINSTGTSTAMPSKIEEFPFTSKTEDEWKELIKQQLVKDNTNFVSVVWYLGFIGVTYHLVGQMAKERESEMSDLLESMMPNLRRWEPQLARLLSHHLAFTITYGPGWIIMGIIAEVGLFTHSNGGIVVIGFLLAGLALTSFSILGAAFFKKAQLSGITIALVVIVLGIVTQIESKKMSSATVVVLSVLFTPMAFVHYMIGCSKWESRSAAINLVKSPPDWDHWAVSGIVFWICMILQILWYPVLAAFVERWLYGTAAARRGRKVKLTEDTATAPVKLTGFTKVYRPHPLLRPFLWLFGIKSEPVYAANELNLSATKGEIQVLVGANGCGKSTTLNAIAGLGGITRGTIEVDGTGGIGLCPQKNVLWNPLTVRQHAEVFNGLKTTSKAAGKEDIASLVATCDLKDKIDTPSRDLSGGQKRKLQLICMLTGGSRVCCVDEVSGGLDPLSRRKIWNILLAERGKRTVILTTHFLDEAEFLADKMVIMHLGELKAEGSVSELKAKLGSGYRVHILPNVRRGEAPNEKNASTESIHEKIKVVPDAAAAIKEMEVLEREGNTHYQITGPTIEEVFMKLAANNNSYHSNSNLECEDEETSEEHSPTSAKAPELDSAITSRTAVSAPRQIAMLFLKRLTVLKRNPMPILAALAIGIVGAGFVSLLTKNETNPGCRLIDQVHIADNQNLSTKYHPSLVVGPPSAFNANSLQLIFNGLPDTAAQTLGTGNGTFENLIHTVGSLDEFNTYMRQNQANVTPGGFWLGDSSSAATLGYRADIAVGGGDEGITGVYNGIFLQSFVNMLLTNTSIVANYAVFDFPWPSATTNFIQFVFYFGLILSAYPAFFALYPTRERLKNVRALEYSNGVRPFPLWFAYLLFDFIVVLIISTVVIAIFAGTSNDAWWNLGYMFLILILYGIASILLSYVITLVAKSQLAAFAFSAGGQAFMCVMYLTAYITIMAQADPSKSTDMQLYAHFTIGLITPVGQALRAMLVGLNLFSALCEGSPPQKATYPGKILLYGGPIVYLIGQSLFLFALLVWSDHRFSLSRLRRRRHDPNQRDAEDLTTKEPEVLDEIERVSTSKDGLRVLHIDKAFSSFTYGKVHAVEDLTFGVKPGEVFALVGPNGAGKSTTISMLRGEIQPSSSSGELYIQNISVLDNRKLARSHLGVCPQFDAMDQLSVREHLKFYAGIRGMHNIDANVDKLIQAVGLTAFSTRMAEKLSGGNKRKLSLAIALIGNPGVVLLDEPSSGMDPLAKRNMWKTLAKFRPGRSILLTTHSMEEADALATRVGVIAKTMLDLGTTTHLREKHGHGFHVHLILKGAPEVSEEAMLNVRMWFEQQIPGAEIEGFPYNGQMRFNIPSHYTVPDIAEAEASASNANNEKEKITPVEIRKERSIGELFALMEQHRGDLGIEFYSVSPSTFDEVFLKVVEKHHVGEQEPPKRKERQWLKWAIYSTGWGALLYRRR